MRTLALALAAGVLSSAAFAAPPTLSHQGRIFDALGAPVDGPETLNFAIYNTPSGGSPMWSESISLTLDNGYFATVLGEANPLTASVFATDERYLEIGVQGNPAIPTRLPLSSVPWALVSDTATNVDGGVVDATEIRINGSTVIDGSGTVSVSWNDLTDVPAGFADGSDDGVGGGFTPPTCTSGQVMEYTGTQWSCVDGDEHVHDAADIATGTVDINRLPVGGSSADVAAGDHTHAAYATVSHSHPATGLDALSCSDGEVAVFSSGAWACGSAGGGGVGNLVLQLELNETSGTSFSDTSGLGNDATAPAGGVAPGSGGHAGTTSVNFSGGILEVPAGNTIPDAPQIWIEAWIRPATTLAGTQVLVSKAGSWSLAQVAGNVQFEVTGTGGTCTVTTGDSTSIGNWHHVSGWYDGLAANVSLDGNVVAASCTQGPVTGPTGGAITIGGLASGQRYDGRIDEVRVRTQAPDFGTGFGCPPGFVDIGPKCARDVANPITTSWGAAIESCYDQGDEVCGEADHLVICQNAGALGVSYPDDVWYWTGHRDWERYDSGVTYPAHRITASRAGSCWDNYTGGASNIRVSWDYGDRDYRIWCCRDKVR